MSKKPNLIAYWGRLSPAQRRYIYESLRTSTSKYAKLPLAMLPFVPVWFVCHLMNQRPASQWTTHAMEKANSEHWQDDDYYWKIIQCQQNVDDAECVAILNILNEPVNGPNKMSDHLASLREQWEAGDA